MSLYRHLFRNKRAQDIQKNITLLAKDTVLTLFWPVLSYFDRISTLFLPIVAHVTLFCPSLGHFDPILMYFDPILIHFDQFRPMLPHFGPVLTLF